LDEPSLLTATSAAGLATLTTDLVCLAVLLARFFDTNI